MSLKLSEYVSTAKQYMLSGKYFNAESAVNAVLFEHLPDKEYSRYHELKRDILEGLKVPELRIKLISNKDMELMLEDAKALAKDRHDDDIDDL